MNIFKRLLKIGQAEIHALVDKMEDPIHFIQQGIEDLHKRLAETTENYTKARALVIRTENAIKAKQKEALDYEGKARLLLEKAIKKEIEQDQAEKLALEALRIKKELSEDSVQLEQELQSYKEKALEINEDVEVMKFNISKWERELTTLKAKQKISAAATFANKQMADLDGNSTIDMLERMKTKTEENEALSTAYGETAQQRLNKDIDYVLSKSTNSLQSELEALKKELNKQDLY